MELKNRFSAIALSIGIIAVALIFIPSIFSVGARNGANHGVAEQKNRTSFPSLSGEDAIEELKRVGAYNSLADAVRTAKGAKNNLHINDSFSSSLMVAPQVKLIASDGQSGDSFGTSVAIEGNTAYIGADQKTVGANLRQGMVYVFIRNGDTWIEQSKIFDPFGTQNANFGSSVRVSGDILVIGSGGEGILHPLQGSIYVYSRNGGNLILQAKLFLPTVNANFFGDIVEIMGDDTILVGLPSYNPGGSSSRGGVVVYRRNGTVWSEETRLFASDGANSDNFGSGVAADGNTVVIGAWGDTVGTLRTGSAYIFVRSGTTWTEQTKLTSSDGANNDGFGNRVDISGETVIVGSADNDSPLTNQGAAYIFVRNGTTWTQQAKLLATDAAASNNFGSGVSISGDTAYVGSPNAKIGSNSGQGAVYIFNRNGTAWTQSAKIIAFDGRSGDRFGDVINVKDGKLIVGVRSHVIGGFAKGAAYIYDNPISKPDLQTASDTGSSNTDNITNKRTLSFDMNNMTTGATVDLLRDGVIVSSGTSVGITITLTDTSTPANGVFQYTAQQTINGNVGSISEATSVTVDTVIPTATISHALGQPNTTAIQPINFTLTLSEPIPDINPSDISLSGSTANVASATVQLGVDGTGFLIMVSNVTSDGEVRVTVPADALTDVAGNSNPDSTNIDNVIRLDTTAPTVTINQASDQADPTATLPIRFTVIFNEPVTSFDRNDIAFTGSTAGVNFTNATVSGSGTTYTVSLNGFNSNAQFVRASVRVAGAVDLAGNPNVASTSTDNTITVDNVAPTATINQDTNQADPTSAMPVNFRVIFSEPVNNFSNTGVSFVGSTANILNANIVIAGSGTTYNVAVSRITTSGQVRTSLTTGAATDLLGNPSVASTSTDNVVTFRKTAFDFEGDGKSDLSIFRHSNGQWWYQQSFNNVVRAFEFGTSSDKLVPGDYDGDGKTDIAFWRQSTGEWFVLRSSNLTYFSAPFGISTDTPAPADFDGDAITDLAVFRSGTWFINKSTGGVQITSFGASGDIPQPSDYDGDGITDVAIFRPVGGSGQAEWWILRSTAGLFATPFGQASDKPVPGDYTGDGKTDMAFWRPSTSEWFVLRSDNLSFYSAPFGTTGDIPAPADFDGDNKFDFGIFRPSNATWFILKSSGGVLIQGFGATGDIPVQSAYIP